MRKKLKPVDQSSDVDMTPMLDIVFIMLIFFIVTTSFVRESAILIDRPSMPDDIDRNENATVLIQVNELNDVNFGGRNILLAAVQANVETALSRNPKTVFLVKVAEKTGAGVVVEVVDQVRLAGVGKVAVSHL